MASITVGGNRAVPVGSQALTFIFFFVFMLMMDVMILMQEYSFFFLTFVLQQYSVGIYYCLGSKYINSGSCKSAVENNIYKVASTLHCKITVQYYTEYIYMRLYFGSVYIFSVKVRRGLESDACNKAINLYFDLI